MAASATESIRRSKFYLTEIASSSPSSLSSTLILLASMFERAASVSVTKQSLNNSFFPILQVNPTILYTDQPFHSTYTCNYDSID